jgi:alkylated DNA repair dioxygenase AlkB
MQNIPGLIVIPNFVSDPGEAALLTIVSANPWMDNMRRRVQHYGYIYDYRRRTVDPSMKLGALPEWGAVIAERLHDEGWVGAVPDQMIVNEYLPGQGIALHTDCEPCFGDTVL